jgi:hypothetical protein
VRPVPGRDSKTGHPIHGPTAIRTAEEQQHSLCHRSLSHSRDLVRQEAICVFERIRHGLSGRKSVEIGVSSLSRRVRFRCRNDPHQDSIHVREVVRICVSDRRPVGNTMVHCASGVHKCACHLALGCSRPLGEVALAVQSLPVELLKAMEPRERLIECYQGLLLVCCCEKSLEGSLKPRCGPLLTDPLPPDLTTALLGHQGPIVDPFSSD